MTELTAGTIAFEDFKKLESKEENVSNSSRSDETGQPENKYESRTVKKSTSSTIICSRMSVKVVILSHGILGGI